MPVGFCTPGTLLQPLVHLVHSCSPSCTPYSTEDMSSPGLCVDVQYPLFIGTWLYCRLTPSYLLSIDYVGPCHVLHPYQGMYLLLYLLSVAILFTLFNVLYICFVTSKTASEYCWLACLLALPAIVTIGRCVTAIINATVPVENTRCKQQ